MPQHDNTTMLYKFKSQATGDVIMLEPNGRQILQVLGKASPDDLLKGILEPGDMARAVELLEAAVALEEAQQATRAAEAQQRGEAPLPPPAVTLRQRATPFIAMVKRCQAANKPIVWGV